MKKSCFHAGRPDPPMLGKPDVVVIDTRNPDAFAAGHIPGAVNVHDIFTYLAMSTPEGMAALKQKFADIFRRRRPVRATKPR